jgi:HEAT repeat protein
MTCRALLQIVAAVVLGFTLSLSAKPDEPPRPSPAEALQKKAWDILWEGLHDGSANKRSNAIRALGILSDDPVAAQLAEYGLDDREAEVRAAAATALGEMGSAASISKLENALPDKSISVAVAAAHSLLVLKNDSGYGVYYAVLTGKRKTGEGLIEEQLEEFRDRKKLAEFAFSQGIGFLPYAGYGLDVVHALTKKEASPLRAAAAGALAHDPDPLSGKALTEAVADKNRLVRVAALRAIAMRGDPALLSQIKAAMSDHEHLVRYTAAATVLHLSQLALRDNKQR